MNKGEFEILLPPTVCPEISQFTDTNSQATTPPKYFPAHPPVTNLPPPARNQLATSIPLSHISTSLPQTQRIPLLTPFPRVDQPDRWPNNFL
ncbi:hypothetical protein L484_017286 [Morus notabilis]|uniref:Uncharacterized protein n=1 Tax=Morus notabilis TaxID=981085 RepID=W9RSM3_9ROSA|nr:hypothetical protein L484_017286 [Morus notabilis]